MVTGGARVASKSNRQRRLERARAERRLARLAERTRRRRQVQAAIGGVFALVLIGVSTAFLLGAFSGKPAQNTTLPSCTWTAKDVTTNSGIVDTGLPPTSGEPRTGTETMTIKTDLGDITVDMDLTKVPCTAASMKYLGTKGYYDGVACNKLDTANLTLLCGDPQGNGSGTPGYQFPDEDLPTAPIGTAAAPSPAASASASASPAASPSPLPSYYGKGTVVMANTGPNANGGQFFIVYGDGSGLGNQYSVVGTVTAGLDLVESVGAAGAVDANGAPTATGKPKKTMTIQQLYVGEPPSASPSPSTSPSPGASAS
jgi:peptidyl-prolyl cis-trans isomerase B (cyclophilin B)